MNKLNLNHISSETNIQKEHKSFNCSANKLTNNFSQTSIKFNVKSHNEHKNPNDFKSNSVSTNLKFNKLNKLNFAEFMLSDKPLYYKNAFKICSPNIQEKVVRKTNPKSYTAEKFSSTEYKIYHLMQSQKNEIQNSEINFNKSSNKSSNKINLAPKYIY